jgi:hypothetical protein
MALQSFSNGASCSCKRSDTQQCRKPVVNGSAKFNDRFPVYENSEVGIAQPTLVQVILTA